MHNALILQVLLLIVLALFLEYYSSRRLGVRSLAKDILAPFAPIVRFLILVTFGFLSLMVFPVVWIFENRQSVWTWVKLGGKAPLWMDVKGGKQ